MLLYDVFYYAKDGTQLTGFDRDGPCPNRAPEGEFACCRCTNGERHTVWLDENGTLPGVPEAVQKKHEASLSNRQWVQECLREEHFSDPALAGEWLAVVRATESQPQDLATIRQMVKVGKKITLYQKS